MPHIFLAPTHFIPINDCFPSSITLAQSIDLFHISNSLALALISNVNDCLVYLSPAILAISFGRVKNVKNPYGFVIVKYDEIEWYRKDAIFLQVNESRT